MKDKELDFEVGIIGGGPAGASMAAYLAKAGIRCVVFESELFPRPHVGESLVPSSTRVFKEIDFLNQMEEHNEISSPIWSIASFSCLRKSIVFLQLVFHKHKVAKIQHFMISL